MSSSLDTETAITYYAMADFPQLKEFLQFHFNITNDHGCVLYQISSDGQLCKQFDDFMFFSFDTLEYNSNNSNLFFDDLQRSDRDPTEQKNLRKAMGKPFINTVRSVKHSSFEEYALFATRYIDSKVYSLYETKCCQFLKIVYDNERNIHPRVVAICLNRMFSKQFKTSMLKYSNNKKTKALLQEFRKTLSLL